MIEERPNVERKSLAALPPARKKKTGTDKKEGRRSMVGREEDRLFQVRGRPRKGNPSVGRHISIRKSAEKKGGPPQKGVGKRKRKVFLTKKRGKGKRGGSRPGEKSSPLDFFSTKKD